MKKNISIASNILLTLILTLLILSFAVVATLNFRPLYYMDIHLLNISESSGIPENEIKENYDALISYNSALNNDELAFPSLAMSREGQIHFQEVKAIFVKVQYLLLITAILFLAGIYLNHKKRGNFRFLKYSSILSIVLPLVLGALIALNWDTFFVTFHELFFDNDFWIFDAAKDPVITILPDTFFMHCAIMILVLIGVGSLVAGLSYRRLATQGE